MSIDGIEAGATGVTTGRRRHRRLSTVFLNVSANAKERVTVADLLDAMGNRGFAALLVLFAAFNMLPLPPGSSAVLGLPLLFVSAQMTFGGKRAWMPKFIRDKSLTAEQFRGLIERVVPRLKWLERLIAPRYWPFWRRRGDQVIGAITLILSVIVVLPIPLGNWLPAFAIGLLGLALSERDGILFAIGGAVGLASLAVVFLVVGAAGAATNAALGWMF